MENLSLCYLTSVLFGFFFAAFWVNRELFFFRLSVYCCCRTLCVCIYVFLCMDALSCGIRSFIAHSLSILLSSSPIHLWFSRKFVLTFNKVPTTHTNAHTHKCTNPRIPVGDRQNKWLREPTTRWNKRKKKSYKAGYLWVSACFVV